MTKTTVAPPTRRACTRGRHEYESFTKVRKGLRMVKVYLNPAGTKALVVDSQGRRHWRPCTPVVPIKACRWCGLEVKR